MSNEPKWTVVVESSDNYVVTNGQLTYGFMFEDDANDLCNKLNRLEAEVERLKEEIKSVRNQMEKIRSYSIDKSATIEKLQSDLERCKAEAIAFYDWLHREGYEFGNKAHYAYLGGKHYIITDLINKFRASQPKTNER